MPKAAQGACRVPGPSGWAAVCALWSAARTCCAPLPRSRGRPLRAICAQERVRHGCARNTTDGLALYADGVNARWVLAVLLLLLTACGGEDAPSVEVPAAPPEPMPEGLAGAWIADTSAVRDTVLRHLRASVDITKLPPGERAGARADMEKKADEFVAAWSLRLVLRDDGTFVYRLAQPRMPVLLRAGRTLLKGTLLSLLVEGTKNDVGKTVADPWPARWLKHEVRWEDQRLRFKALGRETFEFLLYRE